MTNKEIIPQTTLNHNIEAWCLKISNLQYKWTFPFDISKIVYIAIVINNTVPLKQSINFMTLSQRDDYGQISVSTNMKLQIDLFCISEIKCTSLSIEIKKMKFFYQPAKTHFTVMTTRDNKYISSKILWIR